MNDSMLRLAIFLCALGVMSVFERRFALLPPPPQRLRMKLINLLLGALGAAAVRLLVPLLATLAALGAGVHAMGVLATVSLPVHIDIAIGILVLDLAIYWQHRWMHTVPFLWRLHRTHHLDEHLDATSAVRFHPLEILFSASWRALVILAVGIDPLAVLIFEIAVNAAALFHHSNIGLPPRLDWLLRWAVVTPAMHRVHHSVLAEEQRTNFGFSMTWWDRLFRSYRAHSAQRVDIPRVGVAGVAPVAEGISRILLDPFK